MCSEQAQDKDLPEAAKAECDLKAQFSVLQEVQIPIPGCVLWQAQERDLTEAAEAETEDELSAEESWCEMPITSSGRLFPPLVPR